MSEFQKIIYFCFIDYAKAFDCVDHNKLWKILQEMGTPDPLTYLLRNLYGGQEAAVRTLHGTTEVPNQERSITRLYIITLITYMQTLITYVYNLYADYIMQNAAG